MGLFKTAAKVAVASSVHGRVQRRQQSRWAAQDQAAAQQTAPVTYAQQPPPPAPTAQPPSSDNNQMLAQLKQLGELRDAGVLTDQEFQGQKARILAG